MFTASDNTTVLVLFVVLGILGWGYYRARPYGKLGLLSWLQSVALMSPWLLFFTLAALGIYLNVVSILFLFVASTGLYIMIGRKLREIANQDAVSPPEPKPDAVDSSTSSEATQHPPSDSVTPVSDPISPLQPVPLSPDDLKIIQGIFGVDTFFATETIPYQDGAIFKGNLRSDPETAYQQLSTKLQQRIGDRLRLFLVDNPDGKPVVIVLPRTNEPATTSITQKILALILGVITVGTIFEAAGLLLGFDFSENINRYPELLPIAIGIITILMLHEIAHQVIAKRHNIKFSWPFFIPTIQIGTFGAFNRFESVLPNRTVLFDVAFAGPAAGGGLSLLMLISGLFLSHPGSLFKVPTEFFQGSVLVGTLSRAILGSQLHQTTVDIHPLALIGWFGLVITALNLMPAGQLDGGRIMQAIYGRKIAGRSTLATFIVLAIASLANPLALYWALVILILQRNLERPSLNELTEPDDTRAALGLLVLFLMIATLFPLTPGLARGLGIGS
ncbi:site-2 protease family protein [Planktothrix mougeotii]|uniref:Site-2 protease family protein n=1 Tax=Planktothrix mougeotii LEGE 06226 TaxID=1828728 RepID=A0ABR9U9G4_9CYAN|nr:site-2 protease family protein [Planktothrix mougeotii]MBE9143095.1 site-2 protease family protein [Planktothrix mougeotii LEGE 06226]